MRYDAEPSAHVYDRQNVAAGLYANPLDATNTINRVGTWRSQRTDSSSSAMMSSRWGTVTEGR